MRPTHLPSALPGFFASQLPPQFPPGSRYGLLGSDRDTWNLEPEGTWKLGTWNLERTWSLDAWTLDHWTRDQGLDQRTS